jgi:hypothetical protein
MLRTAFDKNIDQAKKGQCMALGRFTTVVRLQKHEEFATICSAPNSKLKTGIQSLAYGQW